MANVNDTTLDCSIEEGAVVHAYSTIAAGFDHANFGIDTLLPAVVPHPSAPGAPSSKTIGIRGTSLWHYQYSSLLQD